MAAVHKGVCVTGFTWQGGEISCEQLYMEFFYGSSSWGGVKRPQSIDFPKEQLLRKGCQVSQSWMPWNPCTSSPELLPPTSGTALVLGTRNYKICSQQNQTWSQKRLGPVCFQRPKPTITGLHSGSRQLRFKYSLGEHQNAWKLWVYCNPSHPFWFCYSVAEMCQLEPHKMLAFDKWDDDTSDTSSTGCEESHCRASGTCWVMWGWGTCLIWPEETPSPPGKPTSSNNQYSNSLTFVLHFFPPKGH